MELLIQTTAILLTFSLTIVKSMHFVPSALSDFELKRLAKAGDTKANYELQRRAYLRLFTAVKYVKEIVIVVLITALLVATHNPVIGLLMAAMYVLVAQVCATNGWFDSWVKKLQYKAEPLMARWLGGFAGLFHLFASNYSDRNTQIASRDELLQLLNTDNKLLGAREKVRLLSALDFDKLKVGDAMVPADKIATVDITETVGPLLLDRLHKAGHNIFVVIKKDPHHIKGLLYMRDLVPLDPDLKEVKDAIRPTVHYISKESNLEMVIMAGLQTGRQLFIVVDDKGNTVGLITLGDALTKLMGVLPLNKGAVATDPKKVKSHENS